MKSEEALCQEFMQSFDCYPEIDHWDLVRILPDGQEGIQAKTSGNIKVLHQALIGLGPKFRSILIPRASIEFIEICNFLGLGLYAKERQRKVWGRLKWIPTDNWTILKPIAKPIHIDLWIPPIKTDKPAGVASPKRLTEWRVKALKMCILLEQRDVTSSDFKDLGLSMSIWKKKWLTESGKSSRLTLYKAKKTDDYPSIGWETEMEKL